MTQGEGGGQSLVKLDDFEGELDEDWQDARGLEVKDKNGEQVGTVEDLYVLQEAQAVHILKVDIDGQRFLIPIDAVTNVTEDGVQVEQVKEFITGSPEFDSDEAPDIETSRAAYAHFGYPDQLVWGEG